MQRKRAPQLAVPAHRARRRRWRWRVVPAPRHAPLYYTGFVEGEERIIRSEVTGRVLQVKFAEGDTIPAEEIIAVLDDRDIQARIKSKQEEIAVLDAEQRTQEERIALVESTWKRDVSARRAELRQAESAADLAERTFAREQELVKTGASTAQLLDDNRARRDQARSARAARARGAGAHRGRGAHHRRGAPRARVAAAAARPRPGAARRAAGHRVEVRHSLARSRHRRADAVHLARRAGAARNGDRVGPRSRRQVRADLRPGRRRRTPAASASASRSSSTASPASACRAR